jgi:adenylosuccinate synthase
MIQTALLVAGLGYGDEGKGSVVDYLARTRKADLVVRYNGGHQAAHHVIGRGGLRHCFSQFGSGTFSGARTYLSRFVSIQPLALAREAAALRLHHGVGDPRSLLTVSPECPVVTPYHRIYNQALELARGRDAHGTCGLGVGALREDREAGAEVILAEALGDAPAMSRIMAATEERLRARAKGAGAAWPLEDREWTPGRWAAAYAAAWSSGARIGFSQLVPDAETAVFEGAQGVLLDERFGFHPHTTWSSCTFGNAEVLLDEVGCDVDTKVGVTRAFATRHGAGPFPSEDRELDATSLSAGESNGQGDWQGRFRFGHMDLVLLRYALNIVAGVDVLALTCLDRVRGTCWRVAEAYQGGPDDDGLFVRDHHGHVVELKAQNDLAGQQRLGEALGQCRAHLTRPDRPPPAQVYRSVDGVRKWIESYGPGPLDKVEW